MTEENKIKYTESIHSLYTTITNKPLQILDIFNNFFGKDKVDMQGMLTESKLYDYLIERDLRTYITAKQLNIPNEEFDKYYIIIEELSQDKFNLVLELLKDSTVIFKIINELPNIHILVHFPEVKITNEHKKYINITHLWAKVTIDYKGHIKNKFTLNRSEYPVIQFAEGYMHSHTPSIDTSSLSSFVTPCTGEGPINNTIKHLIYKFDTDFWELFCLELAKYVTVESIKGTPYKYLEHVGTNTKSLVKYYVYNTLYYWNWEILNINKFKEFIKYFIQGNYLKFNYINGSYSLGMSITEFLICISNIFIKWYNEQYINKLVDSNFESLIQAKILQKYIIKNGKIYYFVPKNWNLSTVSQYIGKELFTFKGKKITLNITNLENVNINNYSIILNIQTSLFILNQILKVLNYRYGRNTEICNSNEINTEIKYL